MRNLLVSMALVIAGAVHAAEPRLAGVMFDGVSAYTPEDLLPLYRDSLGAPFDADLQTRIAAQLCAQYERDGFLAPSVEILAAPHDDSIILMQERVVGKDRRSRIDGIVARLDDAMPFRVDCVALVAL